MARAVFQSGRPTPQDGSSRVGCGTPCSDRASNILLSAHLVKNGTDCFTIVVETCGDGMIQRRIVIVLAPVAVAHWRKELLKEFLCCVEQVGSLGVGGVGWVAVGLLGVEGTW